ncbi:MAG TPA: hypothetical protein VLX61_05805, partial [Anaerolineales bacterium]|nr:hypothetical protein [Anaerolineales bacterium]
HAGGAYLDNCNWNAGTVQCNSTTHSAVTITDSEFNGNNTHAGAAGLEVDSNGALKLTDVSASNNAGSVSGAALNNCNLHGNKCTTTGQAVTLSGTNVFDGNNYDGLRVQSGGAITSGSLEANHNTQFGADLENYSSTSAMPFTLTGTSSFSDNLGGDGLDVLSNGVISVNNITADYNGSGDGALLENSNSIGALSAVKVTGTNWFDKNYNDGLSIISNGAVSLNNMNADYDGLATGVDGLAVENTGHSSAQSVTLTGTNNFNYNGHSGASIIATGAVTLNNINAFCNGYTTPDCKTGGVANADGLYIDNSSLTSSKPQAVTLAGTNNISLSYGDNVDFYTYGAIKINNLTADTSIIGYGADLAFGSATGTVTLTGTNTFDFNHLTGLDVVSNGAITASNLNAVDNKTGDGADLIIQAGQGSVTLTGANTFNLNNGYGLKVQSFGGGAITASNLTALFNGSASGDYGVDLVNTYGTSTAGVTLSGTNTFNNNYSDGLFIESYGAVTASNLTANCNGFSALCATSPNSNVSGVYIDNVPATKAVPAVTLTGTNTFDSNSGYGLFIASQGAINASNLNALLNGSASGDYGVDLMNNYGTSTAGVTLTGTNTFDTNYSDGLHVDSQGAIKANNLNALFNGSASTDYGVDLVNSNGTSIAGVTLTGTNTFDTNYSDGLHVSSNGALAASNLMANCNGFKADCITSLNSNAYGVNIDNIPTTSAAPAVTLTGTNTFNTNNNDGLHISSNGAVTTYNLTANFNDAGNLSNGYGVYIENVPPASAGPTVTLNGVNTFDSDKDYGIIVESNGNITTDNITANYNAASGAVIENNFAGTGTISVNGTNVFLGNGHDGLNLYSNKVVGVTHITANSNSGNGLYADTHGKVTVTCGSFVGNGTGGLGYGWETQDSTSVIMIGTDAAGNASGPNQWSTNGLATPVFTPTCTLP